MATDPLMDALAVDDLADPGFQPTQSQPSDDPQPKLLLFHPGGFSLGDPSFENEAAAYAQSKGFATVQPDYPLCDDIKAITAAILVAAAQAQRGAPVYAYGDSAGAMIAARLAQKGRVRAAAVYSAVPDWLRFVRTHPHSDPIACQRSMSDDELMAVSPGRFMSKSPIVVISGRDDVIAKPKDIRTWARRDPYVWQWSVPGGHLGGEYGGVAGGPGNATYDEQMQRAIDWLAVLARL